MIDLNKRNVGVSILILAITVAAWFASVTAHAQDDVINTASFNSDGSVNQPENWRKWIFVGAPLTPNALNGGTAPFPEYHNVYVEPSAFAAYEKWYVVGRDTNSEGADTDLRKQE